MPFVIIVEERGELNPRYVYSNLMQGLELRNPARLLVIEDVELYADAAPAGVGPNQMFPYYTGRVVLKGVEDKPFTAERTAEILRILMRIQLRSLLEKVGCSYVPKKSLGDYEVTDDNDDSYVYTTQS